MVIKKDHIKVIISGGGTGGHIYPAIAIADALQEIEPTTEILFVGAEGKMEMEKVPQAGYQIKALPVSGIQRRLTLKNLLFPFKLWTSMQKAGAIINEFNPDVVVGVGGYASGPVLKKAQDKKIPTLIQEQNGYAGLTNKWLAAKADKICVAYPNMERYFPSDKILFLGNPVRKDITEALDKSQALQHFGLSPEKPVMLAVGGSLGARTINNALLKSYQPLLNEGVQIIWQTGKFYAKEVQKAVGDKTIDGLWVNAFINRMDLAYACADIVVSRAGALSISELCLAEKPAILVPSPNVAEDHQTKNAEALENEGAAILLADQQANDALFDEVTALVKDEKKRIQMTNNIRKLAKPHAAKDIAKEIFNLTSYKVQIA